MSPTVRRPCPSCKVALIASPARYCPPCQASYEARRGSRSLDAGKRARVLARDGYVCHLCGLPGADSVDHIIPRSRGGSDDESNLRAAHAVCNNRRGVR